MLWQKKAVEKTGATKRWKVCTETVRFIVSISNIAILARYHLSWYLKKISRYRVRYSLPTHGAVGGSWVWPFQHQVTPERLFSCSDNIVRHCNIAVAIRTSLEAENCHAVPAQKCGDGGINVQNIVASISIFGLHILNIVISINLGYCTALVSTALSTCSTL